MIKALVVAALMIGSTFTYAALRPVVVVSLRDMQVCKCRVEWASTLSWGVCEERGIRKDIPLHMFTAVAYAKGVQRVSSCD